MVPSTPASFQPAVAAYAAAMHQLLAVLMEVSEVALDLPAGFFAPFYAGAPNFLRLAYYAPGTTSAGGVGGSGGGGGGDGGGCGGDDTMRYGAHTDYQGFTILSQDAPGLEVQMSSAASRASTDTSTAVPSGSTSSRSTSTSASAVDARWVGIPPVAGALIINAGDLLQHWTNGVWVSNVHRVVAHPGVRERLSL